MAEQNLIETGRLVYSKGHLIGGRSNLLTGVAANGLIGAIRNVGPAELIVDSVDMSFFTTTAAGAVTTSLAFAFYKVAGFTALTNAGARSPAPVPVRKRTNDHQALLAAQPANPSGKDDTFVQVQVSDVAVLTGATIAPAVTFDDPMGVLVCRSSLLAAAAEYDGQSRWEPKNWIPFTLEPDEGIVFCAQTAMGALVGRFAFGVDVHIS